MKMQQITVDEYILKNKNWSKLMQKLRQILLSTGLQETVKWGAPVYMYDNKNVVGLGAFKSYAGLWFFQDALLKDQHGMLINAQEGQTKALRQWRFQSTGKIDEKLVKAYVVEAVRNQKKGRQIKPDRNKPLIIPDKLTRAFREHPEAGKLFDGLNLTKKRDFTDYISESKRPETKMARITRIIPMIKEGIGLNDKYRKK